MLLKKEGLTMKGKYSAVVGFYNSGSSAVIDLLREYKEVYIATKANGEYEHVAFYYPGSLFDAFELLKNNCNPYNCDRIINNFISSNRILNKNYFGWYGSYKKYYGKEYQKICNSFVDGVSRKRLFKNNTHIKRSRFSPVKFCLQIIDSMIRKRQHPYLGIMYIEDSNSSYYSMPNYSTLLNSGRGFVNDYLEMCSLEGKVNVFDHLIWPQQLHYLDELFPSGFKAIVVDRDPRDLFLINKYKDKIPFYSTDVESFISEYKQARERIKCVSDNKVLFLNFEDLIYDYENTVKKIEFFLNIKSNSHDKSVCYFDPCLSIENTQLFNVCEEWKEEVSLIEKELRGSLYNFPFKRKPNLKLSFDYSVGKKRNNL